MLEITISDSEKILLEECGYENVISFCLLLSYGNIKDITNQENRKLGNINISIKCELEKLEKSLDNKIRIWYNSCDNEDLCTLYFLIYLLSSKDIEISTCDVADKIHFGLGTYAKDEIPNLAKRTKVLTKNDQKKYIDAWEKLVEENGDLRIVENETLKSLSFEYLDSKILEKLNKYEKIKYWDLIAEFMNERLCGFYADIIFTTRIDELINQNIIEICEVKKEKNIIGELKEQKYIRIKKHI